MVAIRMLHRNVLQRVDVEDVSPSHTEMKTLNIEYCNIYEEAQQKSDNHNHKSYIKYMNLIQTIKVLMSE